MIVIPLGLGTRPRRLPLVTLALCAAWLWVWATDTSAEQISLRIFKAAADSGVRDLARELFVDYCVARQGERKTCERYAVLVWSGFPGKPKRRGASSERIMLDEGDGKRPNFLDVDIVELYKDRDLAREVREELEDCSESRRCFRYKDILFTFLERHKTSPVDFAALKSFPSFQRATRAYRRTLGSICERFECLVKGHVTYASVGWAQMRHGGFMHMFGNLLVFLVFGAYVEQRVLRPYFLATLFAGGMLGLAVQAWFFSGGDSLALGGSAIVCVAVGMFYVFFLRHRMTFLVWLPRKAYLGSHFKAPVLWCIPLMYVLSDVAGSLDTGFADLLANRVAHSAHLTGLGFGLAAALLWTWIDPMPPTYVYQGETREVMRMAQSRDIHEIVGLAERLAASNPENVDAMEIAAHQLLAWSLAGAPGSDPQLIGRGRRYLIANLQTVLAVRTRTGQLPRALAILDSITLGMPYLTYLNQLGQAHILRIGDAALAADRPMVALRMYDFLLRRFPGTRKASEVHASALAVISSLPVEPQRVSAVAAFIHTNPDSPLAPRMRDWLSRASAA